MAGGPNTYDLVRPLFLAGLNNAAMTLAAAGSPLSKRRADRPDFPGEELVVVSSPFFPHKLSKGYSQPQSRVVESVNGVAIKNLEHLVATLRDTTDERVGRR